MDSDALLTALPQTGVAVSQALDRFMGNQELYLSFLLRLPQAMELPAIRQALQQQQADVFYTKIHNLKGLSGNLSLLPIAQLSQQLLEEYREHGLNHPQRLESILQQIDAAAAPLIQLLKQYGAVSPQGGPL